MGEEQQFRATRDIQSVSFGAADGTTHKLEADSEGVIAADNNEDAEHLERLGLHRVRAPQPAAPAPAAAKADKKED